MYIKVNLSKEQANAVRAIARYTRMTEAEALVSCAVLAVNMDYGDPVEFRSDIIDSAIIADAGRISQRTAGLLPCGLPLR